MISLFLLFWLYLGTSDTAQLSKISEEKCRYQKDVMSISLKKNMIKNKNCLSLEVLNIFDYFIII